MATFVFGTRKGQQRTVQYTGPTLTRQGTQLRPLFATAAPPVTAVVTPLPAGGPAGSGLAGGTPNPGLDLITRPIDAWLVRHGVVVVTTPRGTFPASDQAAEELRIERVNRRVAEERARAARQRQRAGALVGGTYPIPGSQDP